MKKSATPHAVVLVSGGLDSAVLLADLLHRGWRATALSFSYGARHNSRELTCAAAMCRKLEVPRHVVRLDFIGKLFRSALLSGGAPVPVEDYRDDTMRQTVVPFRNGIMLAAATGLAESLGAQAVAIAAHGGDHAIYPDCRPSFMQAFARSMRYGTYAEVRLLSPFVKLDKADLVRRGARLGVDFAATWSCYLGGRRHCGRCGTCRERQAAFRQAGIPDPTRYDANS